MGTLSIAWTILGTAGPAEKLQAAPFEAGASLAFAGLSYGFFRRWRWTWWATTVLTGLLTAAFLAGNILLFGSVATEGMHTPHGVADGGLACLCIIAPIALLVCALPFGLLLRDRKRY